MDFIKMLLITFSVDKYMPYVFHICVDKILKYK